MLAFVCVKGHCWVWAGGEICSVAWMVQPHCKKLKVKKISNRKGLLKMRRTIFLTLPSHFPKAVYIGIGALKWHLLDMGWGAR
jgi:hypothetical protein